jgi:hypothetical protein
MVLVTSMLSKTLGVGTLLVSNKDFSDDDLQLIETSATKAGFEIILSPRQSRDDVLAIIADGKNLEEFTKSFRANIDAPTDDSPFFFHWTRISDVWSGGFASWWHRNDSVLVLMALLQITCALTFIFILIPIALKTDRKGIVGLIPYSIYFACLGLGFMFIEISQLQRLTVFLGHPTYALTVALSTLLVSSGVGSLLSQSIRWNDRAYGPATMLALLVAVLSLCGWITPFVVKYFVAETTRIRIMVSIALLFPMGLFLGMPFPIGMTWASARSQVATPWLWGINGAMSVIGSVISVIVAMGWGISVSVWTGVACYVVAMVCISSHTLRPGRLAHG